MILQASRKIFPQISAIACLVLSSRKIVSAAFTLTSSSSPPSFMSDPTRKSPVMRFGSPSTESADGVILGKRCLLGGDYGGITVNFDVQGNLIPIPDIWVPASMVEWGQVPDYLETIVSETPDQGRWDRRALTILPETGCAIDNLDVIKSQQSLDSVASLGSAQCSSSDVANNNPVSQREWRLETVFDCDTNATPLHRVRLSVLVSREPPEENDSNEGVAWKLSNSNEFAKPAIRVSWERQFDVSPSGGTLADGGGLDGRRVTGMVGPTIHKSSSKFGTAISSSDTSAFDLDDGQDFVTLRLPGNLTLSYSTSTDTEIVSTLHIQVGHVQENVSEEAEETKSSFRCVRWAFAPEIESPAGAAVNFKSRAF